MAALKQGNSDSHTAGSQLLQLLHTDETVSRKRLMLKFLEAEIVVYGFQRERAFPLDVAVIFLQELRSL